MTRTRRGPAPSASAVITDAHTGASREQSHRQRNYAITMAIRTACFAAMIVVPGPGRWVLFACAVFLPYVAVVLANQADRRGQARPNSPVTASDAPALTTGPQDIISGDVLDIRPRDRRDA